ncbi:high frequency lysogenization protein HflD [Pseudomonas sp. F1_0610]|uniref:high frequency lysogenization protein HflD n=1 Tax=Pseudomonas sp. F1_0610 TaxID=3114284 RepID=UPI0039C1B9B9
MNKTQEQLTALAGVFQAASSVDHIAQVGQIPPAVLSTLLGTLLIRNPQTTLEVFGGDDLNLRDGYKALKGALNHDPNELPREALRYALSIISLERQLMKKPEMLALIAKRLDRIEQQVQMFGITHENVIAAIASLYQDTISTFRQRIQVHGEVRYLQQESTAARVRALLFAGIRCAMLWRQLGGHRWQLVFSRGKLLATLKQRF